VVTSGTRRELVVLLGLLDQAQHYLWTSRPKLTLRGPKIQDPNLFYLAQIILNYSKQFIQIRGLLLNTLFSPKGFLHVCIWARVAD